LQTSIRFHEELKFKEKQLEFERQKWADEKLQKEQSDVRKYELDKLKIEKEAELEKFKAEKHYELEMIKLKNN